VDDVDPITGAVSFVDSQMCLTVWPAFPAAATHIFETVQDSAQGRAQGEAASTHGSEDDPNDDQPDAVTGMVLKNGKFKCNRRECTRTTFSRTHELRRHYITVHARQKPEFWCRVQFCSRSAVAGGKAFHRKYRLQDHMRKIHNREIRMTNAPGATEGSSVVAR
jgi:hypothetical protein